MAEVDVRGAHAGEVAATPAISREVNIADGIAGTVAEPATTAIRIYLPLNALVRQPR